jgi:phosphoenolpyruvate synthase/pyruvate phosphate dikinase
MNGTALLLSDTEAPLILVGGKARSLMRLATGGFPVPRGFVLTTGAYQQFIEANNLENKILAAVSPPNTPEEAHLKIQTMFSAATMTAEQASSIEAAYLTLGAVMGTGNITRRLVSGQHATVDGTAGTVTILD